MVYTSRGGKWCRLGALRETSHVMLIFIFWVLKDSLFFLFHFLGPLPYWSQEKHLTYIRNSVKTASAHMDISTPWLRLPPAFLSKFAKTGEANEATVDIFAQQGLLHDAPGGLEVVWQHMARWFDLTAGSESRLQSIDAEPSCIL